MGALGIRKDGGEAEQAFGDGVKFRELKSFCGPRPRAWLALLLALAIAAPSSAALAAKAKKRSSGSAIAAAIVVDMNSGRILHEQASMTPRAPASLTKMMTLYVLFSYLRSGAVTPDTEFVVTPYAASQSPTKLGLKPGATIRAADAVNALVTLSANDAAVTIAENLAGTEGNFARVMTRKAQEIGMMSTLFRNASGLPNDQQVTTARDMAILAQHLIRDFPEYYGCFQTKYFTYRGHRYRNHNRLLFGYKGTDGIKTGYTRAAGFNLTASVKRDDKHLVAVVLGGRTGSQRDAAMRSLLDKSFPKAVAGRPETCGHSAAGCEPRNCPAATAGRQEARVRPRLRRTRGACELQQYSRSSPPSSPSSSSRGRPNANRPHDISESSWPLSRAGRSLHLPSRGREQARRGPRPCHHHPRWPSAGRGRLPEGRHAMVPRALRRLHAGSRQEHLRRA